MKENQRNQMKTNVERKHRMQSEEREKRVEGQTMTMYMCGVNAYVGSYSPEIILQMAKLWYFT